MAANADLIIVNGGLGPTVDDLTAEILAAAAKVSLQEHPQAIAHLQQWCAGRNLEPECRQSENRPCSQRAARL